MKKIYALTISAVVAGLSISANVARASEAAPMPLGAPSVAPPGFIALCEADPAECGGPNASPQTLADIRTWAGRERWNAVFSNAGMSTPSPMLPPPGDIAPDETASAKPKMDVLSVRQSKDAARKAAARAPRPMAKSEAAARAAAPRRRQTIVQVDAATPPPLSTPAPAVDAPLDPAPVATPSMRTIQRVNTSINRAIRRSSDMDTFGEADVWNRPVGDGARGDCEDYVLAKRRALIEAGTDPALLSIAIVRTRRNEVHAVLLVDIGGDEFVLDNLSPWVMRWDEAPYVWLERQAPRTPLTWVRAA